jgi:hypothetical protein
VIKQISFAVVFAVKLFSFSIYNLGDSRDKALLIVGGIHGDEHGGYLTPALFIQEYKILNGRVVVIPNLNTESIVVHQRGVNGDMNRKFENLDSSDKDFQTVQELKKFILNEKISTLLNLHDGSGFYLRNSRNWGQSIVIDKEIAGEVSLKNSAEGVVNRINKNLPKEHLFGVKNTETSQDSYLEMLGSLTYFAIQRGIPSFGVEVSKELDEVKRVLYHLEVIEQFLRESNISFRRNFELNEDILSQKLKDYGKVTINGNIELPLNNLKKRLNYFPLAENNNTFQFSHPLGKAIRVKNRFDIYIAHRRITSLYAQYFKLDEIEPEDIYIELDGNRTKVDFATTSSLKFKRSFKVITPPDIRANVIGYRSRGNETNIEIPSSKIERRFAIDLAETLFRVEFYRETNFIGTIILINEL